MTEEQSRLEENGEVAHEWVWQLETEFIYLFIHSLSFYRQLLACQFTVSNNNLVHCSNRQRTSTGAGVHAPIVSVIKQAISSKISLKLIVCWQMHLWLSRVKYPSSSGFLMIWVRGKVVSNGWWSTRHAKPGALNVFFDVVMKVLMFIELVSGVKYPKITTVGFCCEATICGCFISVPSLFLVFLIFLIFFVSGISLFSLWEKLVSPFFVQLHVGWTSKLFISSLWLPFELDI